jgi:hypothetical protein
VDRQVTGQGGWPWSLGRISQRLVPAFTTVRRVLVQRGRTRPARDGDGCILHVYHLVSGPLVPCNIIRPNKWDLPGWLGDLLAEL